MILGKRVDFGARIDLLAERERATHVQRRWKTRAGARGTVSCCTTHAALRF